MFTWNVEELKLLNMPREDDVFACENLLSLDEKIAFVDSLQEGKLSYLMNLAKKYKEDICSLKKDSFDKPTEYAKKAWVRKNDTQEMLCRRTDSCGDYGDFYLLGWQGNIFSYPHRLGFHTKKETEEDIIARIFHNQLEECEKQEYNIFFENNEKSQYLSSIDYKYYKYLGSCDFAYGFHLSFHLPNNPSDVGFVEGYNYENFQHKELSDEEVSQLDNYLKSLEELNNRIEKLMQEYNNARSFALENIKNMLVEREGNL